MSIAQSAISLQNHNLNFSLHDIQPSFCHATVTIPASIVNQLYDQAIASQQESANTYGFAKSASPLQYIAEHYKNSLIDHLKEFLFKYFVINYLYEQIRINKIFIAGDPRLVNVYVEPDHDARYQFEFSLFSPLNLQEWKYLPFKAPKRKNYKDLDRQVETFINEELTHKEKYQQPAIALGDWVHFSVTVLNKNKLPLWEHNKSTFWLRIGDEEVDRPFAELFLEKKVGDSLITTARCLQDYFSEPINTVYHFKVDILDAIPCYYFCFDLFKHHFRLKTNKELAQKFIEIYSYRNDLSLRRSMAEESLHLLLSKHAFKVPSYLTLRQERIIMEMIQYNPDYHVYRMQKDFKDRIHELAEKQAQEQIFIDQLAHSEGMTISHQDVKSYLNLTLRPRTKEFIYFYFFFPMTKIRGQEIPIHEAELKQTCLREKTLNYIIYQLTKK